MVPPAVAGLRCQPRYSPSAADRICQTIDQRGGRVSLAELALDIPAGALNTAVDLCVSSEPMAPTAGVEPLSNVYRISPAGLELAIPMRVTVAFGGDARLASLFVRRVDNQALAPLASTAAAECQLSTELRTTTSLLVGSACVGDDCCRPATGDGDVLFVMDNSLSMTEEQHAVAQALPYIARALATGDVNEDGVQDYPAFRTLRIATTSTDQGADGFASIGCRDVPGESLRTEPGPDLDHCAGSYPPVQAFVEGEDPEAFAEAVACVAQMGTNGCGFERPMDAMVRALDASPDGVEWPTHDGVLGVVTFTDEDDCSATNPEVFNTNSDTLLERSPNLRCFRFGDQLRSVDEVASELFDRVEHPSRLLLANVVGIPGALEGLTSADLLAEPALTPTIDSRGLDRVTTTCDVAEVGLAFPPRRIVELGASVEDRGGQTTNLSICTPDLRPAAQQLVQSLLERASGTCGPS